MVMQIRRTPTLNNPPSGLLEGQLAVEMTGPTPKLWVGVPTTVDPSGRRLVVPSAGGPQMGVTDGSNAAPGEVGEYLTNSGSATVNAVTFTNVVLTTLNLTPGDWDVTASYALSATLNPRVSLSSYPGATATYSISGGGIFPSVARNLDTSDTTLDNWTTPVAVRSIFTYGEITSNARVSVTTATTLTVYFTFAYYAAAWPTTTGSPSTNATIWARRVR